MAKADYKKKNVEDGKEKGKGAKEARKNKIGGMERGKTEKTDNYKKEKNRDAGMKEKAKGTGKNIDKALVLWIWIGFIVYWLFLFVSWPEFRSVVTKLLKLS